MKSVFEEIKKTAEANKSLIVDTLDYISKNPETGFKEKKTSAYMEKVFEGLGYELIKAEDIPGFYTVLDTGRPGPEILVLGELDALICNNHPEADSETGAVHSCGHNAQSAALVGIAAILKNESILKNMCGKIRLCAVPAEELLELEYRSGLKENGTIRYYGGKAEFLRRGYFDGVELALMVHTAVGDDFYVNDGSVGCLAKQIIYKGKSAHAGGSPWNGINALYAANLGLSAINSLRETFKEEDTVRVHPIITYGGAVVNAIPETVKLESFVRGKSFEAILRENKKVNRALCGAALSIGANVEICDAPGYAPLVNDKEMTRVAEEALSLIYPDRRLRKTGVYSSGSTDMGDLCTVMPVVQPYAPGAVGINHGDNYRIENPETACIASAAWQMAMLYLLLSDKGERAKQIISAYKPMFASFKEYTDFLDRIFTSGDRIEYSEAEAKIKL